VLVVLAAESFAALRAASFGGAEVASSIARRRAKAATPASRASSPTGRASSSSPIRATSASANG
jgi:hypothetical protein